MPVKAGYLLLAGGGGVFVWSGIAGKSVSSVFRQLAGGDSPTSAKTANTITGVAPVSSSSSVPIPGAGGVSAAGAMPGSGSVPAGAAGKMLSFMESKVGHPYSENLSERRGPTDYDCSGLVWAAAQAAGINIPAAESTTLGEAPYFSTHGWQAIKKASEVQEADVCFFVGADPVNTPPFGPIGHVGMCSQPGTLVSAYDTQKGVCYTPFGQDDFVVAFREPS